MRPGTSVYELALEALENHDFPGNIRELKNIVEHAMIQSDEEMIQPDHLRFVRIVANGSAPVALDNTADKSTAASAMPSAGNCCRSICTTLRIC